MRPWGLLVLLAGCDQVFDLVPVVEMPCWDPAHLAHDEDDDGIVDGCDLCPNISDAEQTDADADGVGDDCDPHRDDPHDRLALFDPFTDDVLDARWMSFGAAGQWVIADDVVSQLNTSNANVTATLVFAQSFTNATVISVLSGQGQQDPTVFSVQGIYTRVAPGTEKAYPDALFCFSYLFPNATPPRRALVSEVEPGQVPKDDMPLKLDDPLILIAVNTGTCSGRAGTNPVVTASVDLEPVDGEIALNTHNTGGTFHSVVVIETVP
jgi:hypothetical protein